MRFRATETLAGGLRSPGLRWVTAVGFVALLLALAPRADVAGTLRGASPGGVLIGWTLALLTPSLAALQLRLIATRQGLSIGTGTLVRIQLATHFYGLFLPGYLAGGAIRWYRIARIEGKPGEALASIALNRGTDTLVAVGLGAACLALDPVAPSLPGSGVAWGLAGLSALSLTALYGGLSAGALARRLASRPARDGRRRRHLAPLDAVARHQRGRLTERAAPIGLSALQFAVDLAAVSALASAIGLDVSPWTLAWVRSATSILTLLPISISGIGVREASLTALLGSVGVEPAAALALGVLIFSQLLLKAAAGAIVEAWQAWGRASGVPVLEVDR